MMLETSRFVVSLRFELFYALNTLLNPNARLHPQWRRSMAARLPPAFFALFRSLGAAWELWPAVAATLPKDVAEPTFAELIALLKDQDIEAFTHGILVALIHARPAVEALLVQKRPLAEALARVPKAKRDWLSYIGLYPFDAQSPMALACQSLVHDPAGFRRTVVTLLELFWGCGFQETWAGLAPDLRRSIAEKERLFLSCSLAEFFQLTLIRIEVDEAKGRLGALRGGYQVALADIGSCFFIPSAFNDRRYWSALGDDDPPVVVYVPYFDPSLTLAPQAPGRAAAIAPAELDPALIFKALGDATRFAIASILAQAPRTSVELAGLLAVSKPTVSHHVHQLREAGLLTETYLGGAVRLALNRGVLESLSALAVDRLYAPKAPLDLRKTRRPSKG